MKKLLILTVFSLLITMNFADAQLLQKFKARAGLEHANQGAVDAGLTNAELLAVGTIEGSFSAGEIPVAIEYDEDTGESNAWIFAYREAGDPETLVAIGVIRSPLGFSSMEIPSDSFEGMPLDGLEKVNENWMDSGEMAAEMNANSEFSAFLQSSGNVKLEGLLLTINKTFDFINMDETYWTGRFSNGPDTLACFVHAISGDVICQLDPSSINEEYIAGGLKIFPNPAVETVYIELEDARITAEADINIYDMLGNKLDSFSDIRLDGMNLAVPVAGYSQGVYAVEIIAGNDVIRKLFVVDR